MRVYAKQRRANQRVQLTTRSSTVVMVEEASSWQANLVNILRYRVKRMKECMGVRIRNLWEMRLSNAFIMYSSGCPLLPWEGLSGRFGPVALE